MIRRNAAKRKIVGWSLVIAPVVFFIASLLMAGRNFGGQMFWALMLVTHMPMVAVPFWAVFRGLPSFALPLGWLMFFWERLLSSCFTRRSTKSTAGSRLTFPVESLLPFCSDGR